MQNKLFPFLTALFFLHLSALAQEPPAYTEKHFVSAYNETKFKSNGAAKNGFAITYLVAEPEIWDIDDNHTTHIRLNGRPVLMRIEGYYKDSKRNGVFTFSVIDSANHSLRYKIWEQTFENDKLNGTWKTYNLKGTLVNLHTYKNDSLHGIARQLWIDGATLMKEWEYFGGRSKFIVRDFYKSGRVESETSMEKGMPSGLTKKYHENGRPMQEILFKDGAPNGRGRKFYEDGTLQEEVYLVAGEFEKVRKYYHPNGQLWIEQEYKGGKPWTILGNFDASGNKRPAGTLRNGHGTVIFYNDDGSVRATVTYANGMEQ